MKIIGIRNVEYTSKRTGKKVTGVELHMTYERDDTEGVCTQSAFVNPDNMPEGLMCGDNVEILYDRFGHVARVEEIYED